MSVQSNKPELFVELSTEQQQHLSGGQFGGFGGQFPGGGGQFPGGGGQISFGGNRPDITVRGILTDSNGRSFPVRILGFVA